VKPSERLMNRRLVFLATVGGIFWSAMLYRAIVGG